MVLEERVTNTENVVPEAMLVSVIVLAYNSSSFVHECIASVLASNDVDLELIVLDNGSQDNTFSVIRDAAKNDERVTVLRLDEGLGYAAANNYAATFAQGELLVILNDDCTLEPAALRALCREMRAQENLGVLQCALATADGCSWDSLGTSMNALGFIEIIGSGTPRHTFNVTQRRIFGAAGAAFGIRQHLFMQLGGFDEEYQFLFEETDLCWRVLLCGFDIEVAPDAVAFHRQLARYNAGNNSGRGRAYYLFTRNRLRSLLKNLDRNTLARVLPVHILCILAFAVSRMLRGNMSCVADTMRAFSWNLRHVQQTLDLRGAIQAARTVSDRGLIERGYIENLAIQKLIFAVARRGLVLLRR